MYLIFLDTETTGLNPEKHRIIDIAYKVFDSITGRDVLSYESVISQTADVWAESDPFSLQFNGFSWVEIIHGKTEKSVATEITNDFNKLNLRDKSGVFICQNPSFDRSFFLQLINAEMQTSYGWPYRWLDLASMYWAASFLENRENIKEFTESSLSKDAIAKHFGLPAEPFPHKAMNGVNHLVACYEAMFGKFKSHVTEAVR